jgi:hypothetical protein
MPWGLLVFIVIIALVIAGLLFATVVVISSIKRSQATLNWRGRMQVAAWVLASISACLFLSSVLYGLVIGGWPLLDPALGRIFEYGLLTALAGLVAGVFGSGRARRAVLGLSALMLVMWLIGVSGE